MQGEKTSDTPVSSPTEAPTTLVSRVDSSAQLQSPLENSEPMLDIHAPDQTVHTWKDFFIHIATIVVGLLIALSLEQTVEFLHHRHQRHQLDEALQRDGEANREYIKDDIAVAQGIMDWALGQASALEHAGPTGPLSLRHMPPGIIYSLNAGVWLSAKAGGLTSLLPAGAQNWLEDMDNVYNQTFVSNAGAKGQLNLAYNALDQAIVGHATETHSGDLDLSTLTAAQRSTVVACLRSIAEQARGVMRSLVSYDADNEYILVTPRDQLDNPNAMKRYMEIARERAEAHPALKYTFSAD